MCFLARSYYIFIYIFYSKACALFNPSVLQAFIRSHHKLVWFANNPVPVCGDDWWQPKSSLSWVHGWLQISGTTKDTQVGSIGSKEDVDKKFPRRRPHWSAHLFGHCAGLMLADPKKHIPPSSQSRDLTCLFFSRREHNGRLRTDSDQGITATGTEFKVAVPDWDMNYQGEMINELWADHAHVWGISPRRLILAFFFLSVQGQATTNVR